MNDTMFITVLIIHVIDQLVEEVIVAGLVLEHIRMHTSMKK